MKHLYFLFALLFLQLHLHAQDLAYADYSWEEKPNFDLSQLNENDGEVILKEQILSEFYFDQENFLEYYVLHKAIYVNSDKAIEKNNKHYLTDNGIVESVIDAARVIKPSGEIIELKEEDIQTYENEEENVKYRYYALEGIEKGSIVEILVKKIRYPRFTGVRNFLQYDIPAYDVTWELTSPSHLLYDLKSYNGLAQATQDTTESGQNKYTIELDYSEALDEDVQSAYNANRKYVIYKLGKNLYNGKSDFADYSVFGQSFYGTVFPETSKSVEKKLASIIKDAKLHMSRNEEDKIRDLENYVKERYSIVDASAPKLSNLEFMMDNSLCSDKGALILMANLLKRLEVKHDIVITSSRFDLKFDADYEAYNFLQDMLIYIPSLDKYLAPTSPFLRFGILPPENAGNKGLFISEVKIGDFTSAVSQIKDIPETSYELTEQNLDIMVDLSEDPFSPTIHYIIGQSGYYAQYTQPIFQYIDESSQEDMLNQQLEYFDGEGEFSNISSRNDRSYQFGREPMYIESDLKTSTFSQSVGDNVLFKIGMLIGPQMEMYQDEADDRKIDLETDFARNYKRLIKIKIPEGYALSGLDALKIDHVYSDEQGNDLGFVSDYTLEEGLLTVTVSEYYKNQHYPKELFAIYKQVINAAADFNKLTIVLKKS